MGKSCCYAKLHPWSLGFALGALWGLAIFLVGLIAVAQGGWGVDFVGTMHSVYVGFKPTFVGSLIGGIWGFFHMFITGVLVAWVYNGFLCCCFKGGDKNCKPCDTDVRNR